jgi:hypothetical protein
MALRRQCRGKSTSQLGRKPDYRPCLENLENRIVPASATGDIILDWNTVAITVNQTSYSGFDSNDQSGPTRSSRAMAIVHAAMFDAWNSVNHQYTPYLTLAPNADGASDVAAVAEAAHDTLVALYPHQRAFIDTSFTETLTHVVDGNAETRGINVGKFVAQQILAARANDGSAIPGVYVPDGQIGHHQPDPNNPNQGFLTPAWGQVTPFAIPSTAAIPTPPVPALTSLEYTMAYNQAKALGAENSTVRTTDETELSIFWGYDVARGLGDPPRLYNQIARVIAEQENNTVGQNARMFALLNLAMADAGIQCWGVKYRDIFWRPIVAIHDGAIDGNPDTVGDPTWSPLGAPKTNPLAGEINFTPPFPAYTSGHATFGGAAFKILADFYQTDDVNFSIPFDFISDEFNGVSRDVHAAIPDLIQNHVRDVLPRHFQSFSQAAAENAASRIFLGIHWRFDAVQGVSAGDRIGDYTFDNLLRPLSGQGSTHVATIDYTRQLDAYLDGSYKTFFASAAGTTTQPLDNPRFVNQVYQDLLQRSAETAGVAYWSGLLDQGVSRANVALQIDESVEHRTLMVQGLYQQLLHRAADQAGLDSLVALLGNGGSVHQAEAIILGSGEYFQVRGDGTRSGFLNAMYQDGLGRAIDLAGQSVFGQALGIGISRTEVALAMCASPEFQQDQVQSLYQHYLHRNGEARGVDFWTSVLQAGVSFDQVLVSFLASAEYAKRS